MKGVVFTMFNELVESQFGLETWDEILEKVKPDSGGIYTSVSTYDDAELLALVQALHDNTQIPTKDLVRTFGEYMFPKLVESYPVFVENQTSLKHFLLTVHDIIHVEVRKLYNDSSLPSIEYEDTNENSLTMLYRSPRKMCHLSEGLINGAAKHFNTSVKINHPICLHQGSDHCRIELEFV